MIRRGAIRPARGFRAGRAAGAALAALAALGWGGCAAKTRAGETTEEDGMARTGIEGNVAVFMTRNADSMFVEGTPLTAGPRGEGIFVDILVDPDRTYQEIDGFGGSFTDSSAYLINRKLDPASREELLVKLFDPVEGIGLSVTRQPMGSSDFAREFYSFDDLPAGEEDFELASFSLDHDREDIIPLLQRAKELNPDLKLLASPWSPPGWMKTSGSMIGGSLRPECYDVYARYFVRYLQGYREAGLEIDAVTPQNEPLYVPGHYPGCGMDALAQATFIEKNLGPALREAGFATKILCYDHNWDVTSYADTVLSLGSREYVDGVAWHWYGGEPEAQTRVLERYPGTDVYFTEGSGGEWIPPFTDAFMTFIVQGIRVLNNNSRTFVLWNLALDENNGPAVPGFGRSTCRGVVTVNQETGELTYNLDYYALAHFSRFIRPGARRVFAENKGKVYALGCLNTDGSLVIVAANDDKGSKPVRFTVGDEGERNSFSLDLPGKSAVTFVMKLGNEN